MTKREFLTAVSTADVSDELKKYAQTALQAMDDANAARRSAPKKEKPEDIAFRESLLAWLTDHPDGATAVEIAEALGVHSSKISGQAKHLVEAGLVEKTEVKVPKKGKQVHYKVVG